MSWLKALAKWLLLGLLLLLLLAVGMLGLFRFVNPPTTAFIMAHKVEYPNQTIQQQWMPLDEMSRWMPLAVIASEDQRFLSHWGLDLDAIATAVDTFREGGNLRGASTITQQTAKNLFLWGGRSLARKSLEAGLALGMEGLWPKHRTMEVYLNVAEFGEGIYGVEAASRAYFGVSARHLTPGQAARLAAVLPNPKVFNAAAPSAYIQDRVNWIQRQMRQLGGAAYVAPLY